MAAALARLVGYRPPNSPMEGDWLVGQKWPTISNGLAMDPTNAWGRSGKPTKTKLKRIAKLREAVAEEAVFQTKNSLLGFLRVHG